MEKLHFTIDIKAPASKVYQAIIDKNLYRQWTSEFNPTSTFEGGWNKGDKILFIGTNKDGKKEGMVSRIAENIPGKQVSINHLGFIDGDNEITEGPAVANWAGAMEEYFLTEKNGVTTFDVSLDVTDDFKDDMERMWPKALAKMKSMLEG